MRADGARLRSQSAARGRWHHPAARAAEAVALRNADSKLASIGARLQTLELKLPLHGFVHSRKAKLGEAAGLRPVCGNRPVALGRCPNSRLAETARQMKPKRIVRALNGERLAVKFSLRRIPRLAPRGSVALPPPKPRASPTSPAPCRCCARAEQKPFEIENSLPPFSGNTASRSLD